MAFVLELTIAANFFRDRLNRDTTLSLSFSEFRYFNRPGHDDWREGVDRPTGIQGEDK